MKVRTWLKLLQTAVLLTLLCTEAVDAYTVTNTSMLLSALYALYSPEPLGTDKLYIGGWNSSYIPNNECLVWNGSQWVGRSDTPCDRIYKSTKSGGTWGTPTQNFALNGKSVNDPSIVAPPSTDGVDRSGWLYMYYTVLSYAYYVAPDNSQHNEVGFASSTDGGSTWTDHVVVIGLSNGLTSGGQQCGAWSPSAIVVGSEIFVYYHTNSQCGVLQGRTKLNANGWQINSSDFVSIPSGLYLINIDVKRRPNGNYLLTGTSLDPNNTSNNNRYLYVLESTGSSPDKTFTWHSQMSSSPFLDAGTNDRVDTPRLLDVTNSSWKIQFSYYPVTSPEDDFSVQQWDVSE